MLSKGASKLMRRVLAAVDLSSPSPKGLVTAAELAAAARAELIVLTVLKDPWQLVAPEEVEGYRRMHSGSPASLAAERATERLQHLTARAALPAPTISCRAVFGVPGIEIPRHAEQAGADVVVLGRSAAQGPREFTQSVTAATLRRSRTPVLIAPETHCVYRRVLACVDDSPNASTVLAAALALGGCFDAHTVALHVRPSDAMAVPPGERPRWLRRLERSDSEGWTAVATCETIVRQGDAATEILAAANQADLLAIGYCRGMSLDAAATGVAVRVLRRATCAVLAVPV